MGSSYSKYSAFGTPMNPNACFTSNKAVESKCAETLK